MTGEPTGHASLRSSRSRCLSVPRPPGENQCGAVAELGASLAAGKRASSCRRISGLLSITRGRQPDVAYGATGGSTFVYKIMARGPIKRMGGRPRVLGKSSMLVARVPDTLLTVVDEVGKEQGARGRSESLRKALELLRELKGKKR